MTGIFDYGMGNVRSVQKAMEYLGERAVISGDLALLDRCDRLILPGVGSFGEGMEELKKRGLDGYIRMRTAGGTPVLGICLGMQFLLEKSYEDGENEGLGFCKGDVVRFTQGKVPQIGWNALDILCPNAMTEGVQQGDYVYFVHSFMAVPAEEGDLAAVTDYGARVPAMVARGNLFGCQFHPEKSGKVGLAMLKNFVKLTEVEM